jgi:hypothetical protein
MEPGELEEARKEAGRRKEHSIPPGYMDRKKDDPAGDYLIWRQLMNKAKERKLPVVFITDDTKEDFYQRYKGKTVAARRELREEMMAEAGVPVIFMETGTFLYHAGQYLDARVSPETVDQARELGDGQLLFSFEGVDLDPLLTEIGVRRHVDRLRALGVPPGESFQAALRAACAAGIDLASESWARFAAAQFPPQPGGLPELMVDSPKARYATRGYLASLAFDTIKEGNLTPSESLHLLGMWQAVAEASEPQDEQDGPDE